MSYAIFLDNYFTSLNVKNQLSLPYKNLANFVRKF